MKIHKIITLSASVLMLASVGVGVSNVVPNSSVHASKISRLIRQRNVDYHRFSYYSRQTKRLNAEISRLQRHNSSRHGMVRVMTHNGPQWEHVAIVRRGTYRQAKRHGYLGYHYSKNDAAYVITSKYMPYDSRTMIPKNIPFYFGGKADRATEWKIPKNHHSYLMYEEQGRKKYWEKMF